MSHMNSRTRNRLYKELVDRDGEKCAHCPPGTVFTKLVIDHKDNNNSNNDLSNLQLLCRSHNNLKNPRGPGRKKLSPVCMDGNEHLPPRRFTPEMEKNLVSEPVFRRFVAEEVLKYGKKELLELICAGAEEAGCSTVTATRYLQKMTSSSGKYEVFMENDGKKYVRRREQKEEPLQQQGKGN